METGELCVLKTGELCVLKTGELCFLKTGELCAFKTDKLCGLKTGELCALKLGFCVSLKHMKHKFPTPTTHVRSSRGKKCSVTFVSHWNCSVKVNRFKGGTNSHTTI